MLMMRRQNNSCDQCRKAKRACDAVPLAPVRSSSVRSDSEHIQGQEQPATRPCSYCYKTKKHCTRYWARSQSYTHSISARKRGQSNRRRSHDLRTVRPLDAADPSAAGGAGLFNITQGPAGYHQDLFWWNPESSSFGDVVLGGDDLSGVVQLTGGLYRTAEPDIARNGFTFGDSPTQQTETPPSSITAFLDAYTDNNLEEAGTTAFHYTAPDFSHTYQNADHLSITSFCGLEEGPQAAFEATNRCQSSPDWTQISGVSLSPFSPQHAMTSKTHNNFISQNLMRVYHDVFEHNLSCWVSEETCPYKMLTRNRNESLSTSPICQNPNLIFETAPVQREWGDVWSNRIYTRVIKLDRAAQVAGMIQLTRSEDQAASKALHLSIMAFSAQWAQNSRREQKPYSSSACESQGIDLDEETTEEFDRQIQRSLWWQARKALDDSSELECYRVVCAELIFGLTQKPWDRADVTSRYDDNPLSNNQQGRPTRNAPIMTQIQNLLSRDGPPIFIERAVRKAYSLKYAMDTSAVGVGQPGRTRSGQSAFEQHMNIGTQDRQTIGFIYWLVVMFDTVSASMNQRPVVVADRDCQHDATEDTISVEQGNNDQSTTRCSDQRWVIHLFIQDDPKSPTKPLRWPCPYDAAARAITRSGPVKILLYRHLHYLQDAIQRGYRGELIEEIIRNAVLVYRYWNTTYGVFFRDLIQNYGSIPARIQSWSFCILAHWHLATLILADLLEWADETGLGDFHASQVRAASATVENIRRASADELADLARIVTPTQGMAPPPQLPGFHSAVNRATILTEPWTTITIRAFSKAFLWHFGKAQPENQNADVLSYVGQDVQRSISQCADCVKALWQLGKKSDMALTIAETLASALAGLEQ
ncbi:hypothetical protein GGR58DRAFT_449844 [Xylaria digitata]|nr:hypothetical protein GGR58DRAFT_449844 [Xylaria digitata]